MRISTLLSLAVPVLLVLLLTAVPQTEYRVDISDVSLTQEADTAIVRIFEEECASCHGKDGMGKTRAGRRAGVKDFTDAEYQSTWTDEEAFNVVTTATKDGEELKNKKPFKDKLTPDQIKRLVQYVRTFASE